MLLWLFIFAGMLLAGVAGVVYFSPQDPPLPPAQHPGR